MNPFLAGLLARFALKSGVAGSAARIALARAAMKRLGEMRDAPVAGGSPAAPGGSSVPPPMPPTPAPSGPGSPPPSPAPAAPEGAPPPLTPKEAGDAHETLRGGVAAESIELFKGLAGGIIGTIKGLNNLTHQVEELNRPLAQFSGEIAGAFMQLEGQRIHNKITMAQSTGSSAAYAASAKGIRETEQVKWEAVGQNAMNTLSGLFDDAVTAMLYVLKPILKVLEMIEGKDESTEDKDAPATQLLKDMADGKFLNRRVKPLDGLRHGTPSPPISIKYW